MAIARLTGSLRRMTGDKDEIRLAAGDIKECIDKLEQYYPGIKKAICDQDGFLLDSINIFLNGDNIRHLQGLETALQQDDEVVFMSAFAGG